MGAWTPKSVVVGRRAFDGFFQENRRASSSAERWGRGQGSCSRHGGRWADTFDLTRTKSPSFQAFSSRP